MRLFIALRLEKEACRALIRQQDRMRARGLAGRWTPEENLHLTLAFIGEAPRPEPALQVLESVEFEPFSLELQGMGAFEDVWWAGVAPNPALEDLARKLRRGLAEAGIPYDRKRFRPHITLLRGASFTRADAAVPDWPGTRSRVDRAVLMRSERGRSGMIYTEIEG